MTGGNISSEKIDLLIYGPSKPIIDKGFSDQYVLHRAETRADLERITPAAAANIRGAAVTYSTARCDAGAMAMFPKLVIVSSFGVGYDHVEANYAREHNIIVTNTPDVLTEEVADIAMGLLIATLREFIKADRYLRSGLWTTQQYPLSAGSLRDRRVGFVGMGRIGQAIARRLEASLVPVVYHTRNPVSGLKYKHYPDLIEMAKAVDTLMVIVPGGPSTAKMINADVFKALGPRGAVDPLDPPLDGAAERGEGAALQALAPLFPGLVALQQVDERADVARFDHQPARHEHFRRAQRRIGQDRALRALVGEAEGHVGKFGVGPARADRGAVGVDHGQHAAADVTFQKAVEESHAPP